MIAFVFRFYTLLVISTAIFKKAPFKNLIANGLVLAADGQKMSKSKKNYPDPMEVLSYCVCFNFVESFKCMYFIFIS